MPKNGVQLLSCFFLLFYFLSCPRGKGGCNLVSCPKVGSNCCRAFSSCVLKNWASIYFFFPRGGCQKLSFMPTSGCQNLSFMPTSGRPHDQLLRTFSAFSGFVAVFGLLFQRPFSLSVVDRSIDRLSRNRTNTVTQVVQSSAKK